MGDLKFEEWFDTYRPDAKTNMVTVFYKDDMEKCWEASRKASEQHLNAAKQEDIR